MHSRTSVGWSLAALLLMSCPPALAADDATLLRVFLTDGTSLVSYGEPARVDDRVIFSLPTASTPNPPLHLINLSAQRVDWERTNRYATAARAAHYFETQAELDYAALSNRMAQALDDVTRTADGAKRLAIAEDARKTLASWPRDHYNYRLGEVRQMLSLLDEAIADLRAATGNGQFAISLSTFTETASSAEPLAPPPTAKDAIEQVLIAARLADTAAERTALIGTALEGLDRDAAVVPSEWLDTTREKTKSWLEAERRVDRAYQSLTARIMILADRQARAADVSSLSRLVDRVHRNDLALGGQRPETVGALIAAVEARLDAARRLRLARDRWALRAPAFRQYRVAIQTPLDRFATLEKSLQQIKALAGSSSSTLAMVQRAVSQTLKQAGTIAPPDEFRSAHALLVSALHLAANAAQIRREATLADDISRAWDASSAAAGALMLGARAKADMQSLLRPPQLR